MDAFDIELNKLIRINEEQRYGEYSLHWLSFVDRDGTGLFQHAVCVWEKGYGSAFELTRLMDLNPGGECVVYTFPNDDTCGPLPAPEYWNRKLTKAECARCDDDREARHYRRMMN